MNVSKPEQPIRATGIDAVFYSVREPSRAIAFYKELLDVRSTTFENEHGAEFVLADGSAFGIGALPGGVVEHSGYVLFAVSDVSAAAERVRELGGTFDGEVRTYPTCRSAWCSDPDGNAFVLHERTTPSI